VSKKIEFTVFTKPWTMPLDISVVFVPHVKQSPYLLICEHLKSPDLMSFR